MKKKKKSFCENESKYECERSCFFPNRDKVPFICCTVGMWAIAPGANGIQSYQTNLIII